MTSNTYNRLTFSRPVNMLLLTMPREFEERSLQKKMKKKKTKMINNDNDNNNEGIYTAPLHKKVSQRCTITQITKTIDYNK